MQLQGKWQFTVPMPILIWPRLTYTDKSLSSNSKKGDVKVAGEQLNHLINYRHTGDKMNVQA